MTFEELIRLQNELRNLIQNHQIMLQESENNNSHGEPKTLSDAASLADRIEELNDRMNMLERQLNADKGEGISLNNHAANSDPVHEPKKKLEFLNIFRIEPRYLHDGLPTNRKSKRKAVPKSSYQSSVECKINQSQPSSRRRIIKKRTLERNSVNNVHKDISSLLPNMSNTSPTNIPSAQCLVKPLKVADKNSSYPENNTDEGNSSEPYATENSTLPSMPNRFITETTVYCSLCNNPFIVHQVGDSLTKGKMDSESICFPCQVSRSEEVAG